MIIIEEILVANSVGLLVLIVYIYPIEIKRKTLK